MPNLFIYILAGLVFFGLVLFVVRKYYEQKQKNALAQKDVFLSNALSSLENEKSVLAERLKQKEEQYRELLGKMTVETETAQKLFSQVAVLETHNGNLAEKLATQKKELTELQEQFTKEFENIANRILKQNSVEFAEANHKNLSEILNPLKEKITTFEKTVGETYEKELRDKLNLSAEVKKLTELNGRISEEANNLTKALKGDVKKQGNWGEVILERVLERSGLRKDQEYTREEVVDGDRGQIYRPDVIIHLPDNKHIIVDSKVSLVAYEQFINAEDDEKDTSLRRHVESLRKHVKELSEKCYQNSPSLNTPDFVLMFLPIEGSFSVAVQTDADLFSYAWDKKIVIVSPTTLLATLRTIASIWKQENQTKNAQEIARLGGALYDKLAGCIEDLVKVKNNIDRAGVSYNDAIKKMQTGAGNVFVTAEKMKQLGAKTSKILPEDLL